MDLPYITTLQIFEFRVVKKTSGYTLGPVPPGKEVVTTKNHHLISGFCRGNRTYLQLLTTWRIIPLSKWLITMVIVSPLGLWDLFQMAFLSGQNIIIHQPRFP